MNDLINVLNIKVEDVKRVFSDVFTNTNCSKNDLKWVHLWNWFFDFTSTYINTSNININQKLKCNNTLNMNEIFLNKETDKEAEKGSDKIYSDDSKSIYTFQFQFYF
jgi:hypothetical protein